MFRRLQREPEQELMSDAALHRASLDGSRHGGGEQALAELYRRHGTLIYRYSLRMCQDPSIAEEVTQEVFLALLRSGRRFPPGCAGSRGGRFGSTWKKGSVTCRLS
jgi:DNA-directed RNA polymerase specialized sigma24 family protein